MGARVGIPSAAFHAVQRALADRWVELARIPRDMAYLECTTWYLQVCAIGRDFDADHPRWRRFLAAMATAPDPDALVEEWAAEHARQPRTQRAFGYAWDAETATVRLHVRVTNPSGPSPLAAAAIPARRRELRRLVADARRHHPGARRVRGRSWLYNVEAYRRLFPPAFLASLRPIEPELQFLSTWGQLLDRRGGLRREPAAALLARVAAASTTADLEAAFPLPLLETYLPIEDFAEFYGRPMRMPDAGG